jgi:hypothetical protein
MGRGFRTGTDGAGEQPGSALIEGKAVLNSPNFVQIPSNL